MKFVHIFSRVEGLTKQGMIDAIVVINRVAFGILLFCLLFVLSKLL